MAGQFSSVQVSSTSSMVPVITTLLTSTTSFTIPKRGIHTGSQSVCSCSVPGLPFSTGLTGLSIRTPGNSWLERYAVFSDRLLKSLSRLKMGFKRSRVRVNPLYGADSATVGNSTAKHSFISVTVVLLLPIIYQCHSDSGDSSSSSDYRAPIQTSSVPIERLKTNPINRSTSVVAVRPGFTFHRIY